MIDKARDIKTLAELGLFIAELKTEHSRDIVNATAAAMIATFNVMNSVRMSLHDEAYVGHEMICHLISGDRTPYRITFFEDFLYPQYERRHTRISKKTMDWLQGEARKKLAEDRGASYAVTAHWKSIDQGEIPFGFKLSEDDE